MALREESSRFSKPLFPIPIEQISDKLPPQASHMNEITDVPIAPPRVRTVEEILEETKISITDLTRSPVPSEFELSRNEPPMGTRHFELESQEKAVDRLERSQRKSLSCFEKHFNL